MSLDLRDDIVSTVGYWAERSGLAVGQLLTWLGLPSGKYHAWQARRGLPNQHNAPVPQAQWLLPWEREAIIAFAQRYPNEGYRRLTYRMLDADVVATSPSSVYRVLKAAGLIPVTSAKPSLKGTGFIGPTVAHEHWHLDVSYLNIAGTFYYLCAVLDGYSRFIVHWGMRESMTEQAIEVIVQGARERFPGQTPRIISDNGPQFIAKDFKEFIREAGMTHVRTSPYYPQSNGKIERWHQSIKRECLRPQSPVSLPDARTLVSRYVEDYNTVRLHSAIGYITPADQLEGRAETIFAERRRKLSAARIARWQARKPSSEVIETATWVMDDSLTPTGQKTGD
jgi:transposase InsO family protein